MKTVLRNDPFLPTKEFNEVIVLLTVGEIKRHCYFSSSYSKGQELYYSKKYRNLRIIHNVEDGSSEVTAEVKGSGSVWYNTRVVVSADGDDIIDYSCECASYQQTESMCKHCVAVALGVQAEQKSNHSLRGYVPAAPVSPRASQTSQRSSDYALKSLLQQFFPAAEEEPSDLSGSIQLEPYFTMDSYYGKLKVEFQIGKSRLYVVKDILCLLAAVEQRAKIRYGKNLEFVHTPDAFAPEALRWLDIMKNVAAAEYQIQDLSSRYTEPSANSSYRSLSMGAYGINLCLSEYLDKEIPVPGLRKKVVSGNPPLTMAITGVEQGAELTLCEEELQILPIYQQTYLVRKSKIYCCTEDFSRTMLPLLQNFGITAGQRYSISSRTLFMAPSDYRSFCRYVLPKVEPYMEVVYREFDLQSYQPIPAQFRVYLTIPENTAAASSETLAVEARCDALYGEETFDLADNGKVHESLRDIEAERKIEHLLRQYLPDHPADIPPEKFRCEGEEHTLILIQEGIPRLQEAAELMIDQKLLDIRVNPSPKITFGISLGNGLLTLNIGSDLQNPEEIYEILQSYRMKKKYHRLKTGELLSMDGDALRLLQEVSDGLQLNKNQLERGTAELPQYRAAYLDEMAKQNSGSIQVSRDAAFRRMIADLDSYQNSEYEVPASVHAELREYQTDGFRWLCTLARYGLGGILGDDMGLGKTLQVIAYFAQSGGKSLVVCPASLVYNWESELRKFAPELSVVIITGDTRQRKEILENLPHAGIAVTSYDLLKRDVSLYENLSFDCMVVDEAQYIKNAGTQAAKAVKAIRSRVRFALTGTPIENRLSDLWSIFDFIMPGYLYSYQKFCEEMERPISAEKNETVTARLKAMVAPFLLRRKKENVLKDLPPRLEQPMYVSMTSGQEKLYRALEDRLALKLSDTSDTDFQREQIQILAELTRMRQVCCSPSLVYEDYDGGSGKIDLCMELLQTAAESGHRVLVFSQFTTMLEQLIAAYCSSCEGTEYLYLSGKNTKEQRKAMVERFQAGDVPAFFISLKAGGTGLNLTAADTVIHVDPWWNAAAENQAADRTHRIGQDKVVTVFKLVTRGTIEERILELQERKKHLAESVLSGEGIADTAVTRETLLHILGRDNR